MKKYKVFGIFSLLIMMLLISCENNRHRNSPHEQIKQSVVKPMYKTKDDFKSYDGFVIHDLNRLKSPVILIGKYAAMGSYSIVVIDANDSIRTYGNLSTTANCIGESRLVGDTIK